MRTAPLVVLLGTSVLMDGVAACLTNDSAIQILRRESLPYCSLVELRTLQPDIIIFELNPLPADELVRWMSSLPGAQWLALDPNCSQVSVVNSRKHATQTMQDLLRLIQVVIPGMERI